MNFFTALKAVLRSWATRLGWVEPQKVYIRDAHLADVINRIVCTPRSGGAFIVAVETRQAMIQLMSYMEKNGIPALAITDSDLGRFNRTDLRGALHCMSRNPTVFQVYVINKAPAAVGWRVPEDFKHAWGTVHMLATFTPRDPWKTQYEGRLGGAV